MNRIYDKQEIARMLDKFMAGETSLNEEQMLAEYFRTNEVDDEWLEFKEMFALFDSGKVDIEPEKEVAQPINIDNKKVRTMPKDVNTKPKIIIRWMMTGIAASILFVIGFYIFTNNGEDRQAVNNLESKDITQKTTIQPLAEPNPSILPRKITATVQKPRTNNMKESIEETVQMSEETRMELLLAMSNQNNELPQVEEIDIEEEIRQIRQRGEQMINMYEQDDK